MFNRFKTWLIGVLSVVASFFFYRAHLNAKAKERLTKDLEAEKRRTQQLDTHVERTTQAIQKNNAERAEVQAHLETGRRDYFERSKR